MGQIDRLGDSYNQESFKNIEEKFLNELSNIKGPWIITAKDLTKRGFDVAQLKNLEKLGYISFKGESIVIERKASMKLSERQFHKEIKQIIQNNPGVIQRDLVKKGFNTNTFWELEHLGYIKREKFKNSYKLFLNEYDENKIKTRQFLFRSWSQRTRIPVEGYPDSLEQINNYFGRELLQRIFKISGNLIIGTYTNNFKQFCHAIGACLKFDMNEPLRDIINKYWTEECNEELKKFYSKYGFFSSRTFVDFRLQEVIGKDNKNYFYAELEEKANTFEIKWCGTIIGSDYLIEMKLDTKEGTAELQTNLDNISLWTSIQSRHIPWDYAQHLRFVWGLKPEIIIKKCIKCGEYFHPFDYLDNLGLFDKVKNYPIKKSVCELDLCPKHL